MAYSADIDALNPSHRWDFDGDSTDQISSANGTDTSIIYTSAGICEDVTNCAETNAVGDRISIPSTGSINNSAQARKAVAGWFMNTGIQPPPKRIYGEGTNATCFQFMMAYGNNIMLECVEPTNFTLQAFGPVMQPDRSYHLCGIFEGNAYSNEMKLYVDGVKQTLTEPSGSQPGTADLNSRGVAEFGDPAGTVGVGGDVVLLNASINGKWNQWAAWDGAPAVLSDDDIRVELFEKGALPDITISSDTEANMQTALDIYSGSERPDAPLCIRIEPVTGGGTFELELDDITFDSLASIHMQYTGTGSVLTLINTNGSDCAITSAPYGGSIVLKTRTSININVKDLSDFSAVENARVYIEADSGGDLPTGSVIVSTLTNVSGSVAIDFDYTSDQPIIGYVRKGTSAPRFIEGTIAGPITEEGLTETVLLIPDE